MVQATARIERGAARRALIATLQVCADAELRTTLAAQNNGLARQLHRPCHYGVIGQLVVALLARIKLVAAPELDGDYIPLAIVMGASGFLVQLHTQHSRLRYRPARAIMTHRHRHPPYKIFQLRGTIAHRPLTQFLMSRPASQDCDLATEAFVSTLSHSPNPARAKYILVGGELTG
jgi:hypothetical protein